MKQAINHLTLIIVCLLFAGCATVQKEENWPSDLPKRKVFTDSFKKQTAKGTTTISLNEYLTWIRRFYEGSVIYSLGWLKMTEMTLESVEPSEQARFKRRMAELGEKISIEWVQDNNKRNIDSGALSAWGNSLVIAAERKELDSYLDLVEKDVEDLLQNKIKAKIIVQDRYYPETDYDDF